MTYGGQLDYTLPSPEVNTGVETPAVAAIAAIGVNSTGKTYRCIKQYTVGGATLKKAQVRSCWQAAACAGSTAADVQRMQLPKGAMTCAMA